MERPLLPNVADKAWRIRAVFRRIGYRFDHWVPGAPPSPEIDEAPMIGTSSGMPERIGADAVLLEQINTSGIESIRE